MIKRLFLLTILIAAVFFQSCNTEKNREIFDEFEGEEGISMIKLPPGLFLGLIEGETDAPTKDFGNVDFVKLMMFDESKTTKQSSRELASEMRDKFDKYGYELAVDYSSGGTSISAYMLEDKDIVSDLMILVSEKTNVIGLGISGKLDSESLLKFASEVDYSDLKGLSSSGLDFSF